MVLKSHQTLAVGTVVASIASAALLTLIGLCVPYTERGPNGRASQHSVDTQPAPNAAKLQSRIRAPDPSPSGSLPQSSRDAAPQH